MTEAGAAALRQVLYGRRVAIQSVSTLPYIFDNHVNLDKRWWPIVLLPAKAANLSSPTFLMRAKPEYQDYSIKKAAAVGQQYKLLTPSPVRFTADQFAVA
jgi:hypothetical protein